MSVDFEARVRRANLISREQHLERLYDDDLSRRLLRDINSKKEGRMSEMTDRPETVTVGDGPSTKGTSHPAPTRGPRLRSPALVPAILTAVIAIGVIVGLLVWDSTPEVAETPVEIAEQFMAALNDHDADAVLALMAEDGVFNDADKEDRNELRMEELLGSAYDVDCVEPPGQFEPTTRVRCSYAFSDDIMRATGTAPITGYYGFKIDEDGRITLADNTLEGRDRLAAHGVFWKWIDENHPEDKELMHYVFVDEEHEENVVKWEQYLPEFLADLEASG
jgi:hypothetical protein